MNRKNAFSTHSATNFVDDDDDHDHSIFILALTA